MWTGGLCGVEEGPGNSFKGARQGSKMMTIQEDVMKVTALEDDVDRSRRAS